MWSFRAGGFEFFWGSKGGSRILGYGALEAQGFLLAGLGFCAVPKPVNIAMKQPELVPALSPSIPHPITI